MRVGTQHPEHGIHTCGMMESPAQGAMGHLNIQDPPLLLTGRHPRQTGGSIFGGVVPRCMEIQPAFSIPPLARGSITTKLKNLINNNKA